MDGYCSLCGKKHDSSACSLLIMGERRIGKTITSMPPDMRLVLECNNLREEISDLRELLAEVDSALVVIRGNYACDLNWLEAVCQAAKDRDDARKEDSGG